LEIFVECTSKYGRAYRSRSFVGREMGDEASPFARHTCTAGNLEETRLAFFAHAAVTDVRLTAHILLTIVYAT
jgi:hypothetical protein